MAREPSSVPRSRGPLERYYQQPALWEMSRYDTRPEQRLRARIIAAMVPAEVDSVLDVGCGNGFITRHIQAPRVVGLDPSEEALKHFQGECVKGWADQLPFEDEGFDAVVSTEVLEHLSDHIYQRTVGELARVARVHLVIGVPYDQELRAGMTRCAGCGHEYHIDLHQRRFRSPEALAKSFPDFQISAIALIGRSRRRRYPWLSWLRFQLEGPWAESDIMCCPQCHNCKARFRTNVVSRISRPFFHRVSWRIPTETVPTWMVVCMSRRKMSTESER